MKRIGFQLIVGLLAMACTLQLNAQDKPAPSPLGKVYQRVGVTDVEVTYSRPGVKGRSIFAAEGLVPYGKLWRTGANGATKISFSTDVMIGDKTVPAGSYAIFSIPAADKWTIIFNSNTEQGGTGNYEDSKDVVRVTAETQELPFSVETFTMGFNNVKPTSAELLIYWDTALVSVPIKVKKTWE
ncbi:DUF2911 domain-containing protein [Flavilitoribacter nigricans]|uniref:DUF2911 domain-containing protein n=1 Tax=Flavilitoribacter nigricans (strain ATCC 23147 / DSM 23189 / NBRC 102662 / NCIMB 1420 / SS-2) TaxID=1122177 RepID=A0A2D0N3D5_FLAN2|nr:DUF2911 domain-containing protein [Flavilitoribacter nigricans]PHN02659.1 hypothetical protein CRP01_31180 [Flavilitoribacter nigricans DSM 23189 = NBRC 102662]